MEKGNIYGPCPIWQAYIEDARETVERMNNPKINSIKKIEIRSAFLMGENPTIRSLLFQARMLIKGCEGSCQIVRCEAFQRFTGLKAM